MRCIIRGSATAAATATERALFRCAETDDAGANERRGQRWGGRWRPSKPHSDPDHRSQPQHSAPLSDAPRDSQAGSVSSSEFHEGADRVTTGGAPPLDTYGGSTDPQGVAGELRQRAAADEDVSTGAAGDREDEEKSVAAVATAVAGAEALSQRVRDAASHMSDVIDQMSRLLLPTPMPLGLAVLFSQYAPALFNP